MCATVIFKEAVHSVRGFFVSAIMLGKTSFNYLLDVEQPDRVKLTVRPFTPGWTENARPQKHHQKLEDKLPKAITQCN